MDKKPQTDCECLRLQEKYLITLDSEFAFAESGAAELEQSWNQAAFVVCGEAEHGSGIFA